MKTPKQLEKHINAALNIDNADVHLYDEASFWVVIFCRPLSAHQLELLFDICFANQVVALTLNDCRIENRALKGIVDHPLCARLLVFDLRDNKITKQGCDFIAQSKHWKRLVELDLGENALRNNGVGVLLEALGSTLATLKHLGLSCTALTLSMYPQLLKSPHVKKLKTIDLSESDLGEELEQAFRATLGKRIRF